MDQGGMEAALREWRDRRRPEALGELLKAQRNRAYAIALRMTASPPDAEDTVQEAFIKLLTRTHGFETLEAFEVSVYRTIVQCSLNAIQKRRRRGAHETALDGQADPAMSAASPEHQEARVLLRMAVAGLPDDERAPVVLCYYQGMSVVQTAQTLEMPRETVRARLGRALDRLRKCLNQSGKDVSAAAVLALLWADGSAHAPASLCAALDKALPGKACAHIAAPSQIGLAHTGLGQTAAVVGKPALLAPAAIILAVTVGAAVFWAQEPRPAHAPEPAVRAAAPAASDSVSGPAATAESGVARVAAPRSQPGPVEVRKEDGPVKSKLGAMLLVGGMLMPVAAYAGGADDAIAAIAARRDAKAAAAAAAPTNIRAEGGGLRAQGATTGGGWVQTGNMPPGAAINPPMPIGAPGGAFGGGGGQGINQINQSSQSSGAVIRINKP